MHCPMNVKIIGKLMKEWNFTPLLAVLRQLTFKNRASYI
jgi:hypothetical protein